MGKFIRIKNWEQYQHYKDRNPPWIKLHREILTSHTWVCADDASRTLAIAIMLVAAATENKIPADPTYLQRVAYLNSPPDLSQLVETDFIEIIDDFGNASRTLADASTMQSHARPETETETETEKKNLTRSDDSGGKDLPPPTLPQPVNGSRYLTEFPDAFQAHPPFAEAWHDWEKHRKEIKATLKPTTVSRQVKMLTGYSPETATGILEASIQHGWRGLFPPEAKDAPKQNSKNRTGLQASLERILDREDARDDGQRGSDAGGTDPRALPERESG